MGEQNRIEIPLRAANRYVLPDICVVSGVRESVEWRKTKLAWAPSWTVLFYVAFFVPLLPPLVRLVCPLIGIGLRIALGKKAAIELPFEVGRFGIWRVGRWVMPVVILVGLCGGVPVGLIVIGSGFPAVGLAIVTVGLTGVVGTWFLLSRNRGPLVERITPDRIVLQLPSRTAADAFRRVLSGGPSSSEALEGSACAVHPEASASMVCSRCGSFACDGCARRGLAGAGLCAECGSLRDAHVGRERLTDGAAVAAPLVIEGSRCARHPDQDAAVQCSRCETALCGDCVRERPGTAEVLCIPCLARET